MGVPDRRGIAAMVATDEENPRDNTAQGKVSKFKTLSSVEIRFTVDAADPLSLMFAMLTGEYKLWLLLPAIRLGPLLVMVFLLWWMILLSMDSDQKEGNDVYGLYDEQPVFPNWVLVGTVYFAMLVPKVVDAYGTIAEFWVLRKFSRNCRSRKAMILYYGFFCLIIKFVVSPLFAVALSAYIGLMLNAQSLYITLINVLVVFFLNDMDQNFVEWIVLYFTRRQMLLVSLTELQYPVTDKQLDLDSIENPGVLKRAKERATQLELPHAVDDLSADQDAQRYLFFWEQSDLNESEVFSNLRRNWAPKSAQDRMQFWDLIVDWKRGLGISGDDGTTCSIDASFVAFSSEKAILLVTETDWLQLTFAQREHLFCDFPLRTCLFPIGRDSLDLTKHNWKSDEQAKALATILQTNPSLRSLDLSFNKLTANGVKSFITALQKCRTLSNLSLPYSEMNRTQWLSLLQVATSNIDLKIWLIKRENGENSYELYNPKKLVFNSKEPEQADETMTYLNLPTTSHLFEGLNCRPDNQVDVNPQYLIFSAIKDEKSENLWVEVIAVFPKEDLEGQKCAVRFMALADSNGADNDWKVPDTLQNPYKTVVFTARGNIVGTGGVKAIKKFVESHGNSLKFLDISEMQMKMVIQFHHMLRSVKSLVELHAGGNALGDNGARGLVSLLKKQTAQNIYFTNNNMTTIGFEMILQAVKDNGILAILDVRGNNLQGAAQKVKDFRNAAIRQILNCQENTEDCEEEADDASDDAEDAGDLENLVVNILFDKEQPSSETTISPPTEHFRSAREVLVEQLMDRKINKSLLDDESSFSFKERICDETDLLIDAEAAQKRLEKLYRAIQFLGCDEAPCAAERAENHVTRLVDSGVLCEVFNETKLKEHGSFLKNQYRHCIGYVCGTKVLVQDGEMYDIMWVIFTGMTTVNILPQRRIQARAHEGLHAQGSIQARAQEIFWHAMMLWIKGKAKSPLIKEVQYVQAPNAVQRRDAGGDAAPA